jgi:ATP-dependent Clp protease adaptor protein ClpS
MTGLLSASLAGVVEVFSQEQQPVGPGQNADSSSGQADGQVSPRVDVFAPVAGQASRPGEAVGTKDAPPQRKPLDQYKVLLHNDDDNEIVYVVSAVMAIVRLAQPRAVKITLEAHESGLALVCVTHLELAELYREQFTSKGLQVSIERA